jgi:CubicO group peptidase (beta-lactamase class C family)
MTARVGKSVGWISAIFLSALIHSACAAAPPRPETLAPGDYGYARAYGAWKIRQEMRKNDVAGLSIALVDDRKVVWAEGFGFADEGAGIPAGPDTIYRVGSVSKLFTILAALKLSEEGRLGLDRALADYVPGFSLRTRYPESRPITVRSVMTHHSGIPSDHLKGMWTKSPEPLPSLPERIRDEYAAFPPDTVFSYSNLGFSLLGLAVQNAAGSEFGSYLRVSVLEPLGMGHSSFSQEIDLSPLAAKAYRGSREAVEPPLRDVPAGGLNSSVNDLSLFLRMILAEGRLEDGRQLLRPESVREMLRPQNGEVPLDLTFRVGLGWMLGGLGEINLQGAGPVAHHGGATIYHRAQLIVLPEATLGVVVLTNTRTARAVATPVAAEVLKVALETKTGVRQPERKRTKTGPYLTPEELRAFAGDYASLAGRVRLSPAGDHLKAKVVGRSFRLAPRPDGKLQPGYRILGLFPVDLGVYGDLGVSRKTVAGREILSARDGALELLVGERVTPAPIPEAWRRRVGRYEYVNAGDDVRVYDRVALREEDGLLLVDFTLPMFGNFPMTYVLRPLTDDEGVFAGLWRGMGETVRAVRRDGEEMILYSGYELKKAPGDPGETASP